MRCNTTASHILPMTIYFKTRCSQVSKILRLKWLKPRKLSIDCASEPNSLPMVSIVHIRTFGMRGNVTATHISPMTICHKRSGSQGSQIWRLKFVKIPKIKVISCQRNPNSLHMCKLYIFAPLICDELTNITYLEMYLVTIINKKIKFVDFCMLTNLCTQVAPR